jgi:hypothetical protein
VKRLHISSRRRSTARIIAIVLVGIPAAQTLLGLLVLSAFWALDHFFPSGIAVGDSTFIAGPITVEAAPAASFYGILNALSLAVGIALWVWLAVTSKQVDPQE